MARLTGLEPATPGVTGRYSNQLSYNRALPFGASRPQTQPRNSGAQTQGQEGSGGAVDGARTRDPRRDRPVL